MVFVLCMVISSIKNSIWESLKLGLNGAQMALPECPPELLLGDALGTLGVTWLPYPLGPFLSRLSAYACLLASRSCSSFSLYCWALSIFNSLRPWTTAPFVSSGYSSSGCGPGLTFFFFLMTLRVRVLGSSPSEFSRATPRDTLESWL